MATRSRRISSEQWEHHQEKIIDLYGRKSLKDVKSEMLRLYDFNASKSQYEAQLKQWGVRKNVKRGEWEAFFREEIGREVSTTGSTRTPAGFKSKASIERARRWYNCDRSTKGHASATGQLFSVNTLNKNKNNSPPCTELVSSERSHAADSLPELQSFCNFIEPLPWTPVGAGVLLEASDPFTFGTTDDTAQAMITDDDGFPLMMGTPLGQSIQLDVRTQELPVLAIVPFHLARSEQWFSSLPSIKLEETLHSRQMHITAHASSKSALSRALANDFAMGFMAATLYQERQSYDSQALGLQVRLQRLNALIPQKDVVSAATIPISEMNFIRVFLFATINGFTELDHLPIAQVLELLRHGGGLRSLIPHILQTARHTSSAFAESMFRAAIEAKDKDVLELVLGYGLVDKDRIVCFVDGQRFSPIARAASLEAYDIIQTLLQHKFSEAKLPDCGITYVDVLEQLIKAATESFYGTPGSRAPATPELLDTVQRLIKASAKTGIATLKRAIHGFTTLDAAYGISFGVEQSEHEYCFPSEVQYATNDIAYCPILEVVQQGTSETSAGIVGNILALCEQDHNCSCLTKHERALEHATVQAARRGHHHVVAVLLDRVPSLRKPPSLRKVFCGAIMARDPEFIELIINSGAELDPPACHLIPRTEHGGVLLATPLAEAVRSDNTELVDRLKRAGALTDLFKGNRFEPLITATAAAGNVSFARELLNLCSSSINSGCRPPSTALSLAIQHSHHVIVQMLLDSGCTAQASDCIAVAAGLGQEETKSPLQAALEKQDAQLVHTILESNVTLQLTRYMHNEELDAAVRSEDLSVLQDLVCMFPGAQLSESGLQQLCKICMRLNNVNFFRDFLRAVGTIRQPSLSNSLLSCLPLSIESGHSDMIDCLVDAGVNPFDPEIVEEVFESARPKQQDLLRLLSKKANILRTAPAPVTAFGLMPILTEGPGNAEVLDDLLKRGAVNLHTVGRCFRRETDSWMQMTPLGLAIVGVTRQHQPCLGAIESLLRAGSDPDGIAKVPKTRYDKFEASHTGLLLAIRAGSEAIVKLFVDYGSDINKRPFLSVKQSPLQCAAETGQLNIVRLLLEHGAKANGEPARCGGGTALQYAAISGNCNIVAELIEHNAELYALPSKVDGRWPLEGAAEHGRQDMIRLLWDIADTFISDAPPDAHPFNMVMDIPGFEKRHCLRAMKFARDHGHMGCAHLVSELSGVSLDGLKTDEYGVPWLAY